MKLYGYLVLFVLILSTSAIYERGHNNPDEELEKILREFEDPNKDVGRYHDVNQKFPSALRSFDEAKRHSSKVKTKDSTGSLLNATIIQRGFYLASVKVNFIRDEIQEEFETSSTSFEENTVFPLQKSSTDVITYLRVRFHVVGTDIDFGDYQAPHPQTKDLCFVLSGTVLNPVYSLCAPGEDYTRK